MATAEKQIISTSKASCDGGGGSLGHPKVYLNVQEDKGTDCPYCGKHFILKKNKK